MASHLGVTASTLRTWERRYEIGASAHATGAHRIYCPEDIARLTLMCQLTRQGTPTAKAAQLALCAYFDSSAGVATIPPDATATAEPPQPPVRRPQTPVQPSEAFAHLATPVRRLLCMAFSLDAPGIEREVDCRLGDRGVVRTWDDVLCPALQAIGTYWQTHGTGVDAEHLLADSIATSLRRYENARNPARGVVLLATVSTEGHDLPLRAVAAALADHRIRCVTLGGRVPTCALDRAVYTVQPDAVLVLALSIASADHLRHVDGLAHTTRVLLGGNGWRNIPPESGHTACHTLPDAVTILTKWVSGS